MAVESILQSLREHVLDESEPLAGLLRKCLMLGAATGSDALREWARKELNGFGPGDEVPEYRYLRGMPIFMDSISGYTQATRQMLHVLDLPQGVREFVSEDVVMRQGIEELAGLSSNKSVHITSGGLQGATSIWNMELEDFQHINRLYYSIPGSVFEGMLGKVRTALVDFIASLTSAAPLTQLPTKEVVDRALADRLTIHTGDVYETSVHQPHGPTAIGNGAAAHVGPSIGDLLLLMGQVQAAAAPLNVEARDDMLAAVDELRLAVEAARPDRDAVQAKAARLKALGARAGGVALGAATSGVFEAVAQMAANGLFG